jgi:uncharacterized protein YggE
MIVRIGVNVTRATVRQATDDAAAGARSVIGALRAADVAEDDIQTSNLSVGPLREHVPGGAPRLVGYTFTNTVSAIVRDLDRAGSVLDSALAAGGDDAVLESVTFAPDDDGETERDAAVRAREAAYGDARAKAEHLARLAGVTLGSPVAIDETGYAPREVGVARMAMSADAAPPIAAGQITTTVRLRVCFAIV